MALPPPKINIPPSSNTVEINIINTTATIRGVDAWKFLTPPIKGHEWLAIPCFSVLIHHPIQKRTLVFDLGIRKDWWNYSPSLQARFKAGGYRIQVEKNVREILDQEGTVDTSKIEAVIWSHWHFDHIGDPSTFDPDTALIVGPGFKENFLPGYPANPDSTILEKDYAGRELRELDFTTGDNKLTIGRFTALDYFGDGSFYFLDAPGHAVGHICGFARVKAGVADDEDSFVFLGGDAAHHGGEFRPSAYLPLPGEVYPNPLSTTGKESDKNPKQWPPFCPGSILQTIHLEGSSSNSEEGRRSLRTQPFYKPSNEFGIQHDAEEAERTIAKMQEVDVMDNVLVVLAHDESLLDVVDVFPAKANDFVEKGWAKECRWRFLRDFAEVVGWPGDQVVGRRDWSRPSDGEKNDNAL